MIKYTQFVVIVTVILLILEVPWSKVHESFVRVHAVGLALTIKQIWPLYKMSFWHQERIMSSTNDVDYVLLHSFSEIPRVEALYTRLQEHIF